MRVTSFILLISLLSGCASIESLPDVNVPTGAKIGFVSIVDQNPKHAHIGTTIFANFENIRTEQWQLSDRLFDAINLKLRVRGFDLVHLKSNSELKTNRLSIVKAGWSSFHLSDTTARIVEEYGVIEGVDIVIIFAPFEHEGVGGIQGEINGYGLFSRCSFGNCKYEPLERVLTIVATTNPPRLIGWDRYTTKPVQLNISFDEDIKKIPKSEFNKAREFVWKAALDNAIKGLSEAGLL